MAVSENDLVVGPLTPAAGVTTISLDFYFEQASWLEVYKSGSETPLVLNTDYTVAGAGTSSGVVTLATPANGTDAYAIYLAVPLQRSSDMQLRGEFKSEPFNIELDRVWQRLQFHWTHITRSLRISATKAMDTVLYSVLPGQVIQMNGNGTGFVGADLEITVSQSDVFFQGRGVSQATAAAALADGTLVWMDGFAYKVDSTATGTDACTYDLGVDGLVPYGNVYGQHFGLTPNLSTDRTTELTNMRDWLAAQPESNRAAFLTEGQYPYTVSPNWAIEGLKLRCLGTVRFVYSGVGSCVILDGGATARPGEVYFCHDNPPLIEGGASSADGLYLRSVHRSWVGANVRGCGGKAIHIAFSVSTNFNVRSTLNEGPFTQQPTTGLYITSRDPATERASACVFMNPQFDGVAGAGISLNGCILSQFIGGAVQANGGNGVDISDDSNFNTFYGTDAEVNTAQGYVVRGSFNNFVNIFSDTICTVTSAGRANRFYGGTFDDFTNAGNGTMFSGTSFRSAGGVFTDIGTDTSMVGCFDITTATVLDSKAKKLTLSGGLVVSGGNADLPNLKIGAGARLTKLLRSSIVTGAWAVPGAVPGTVTKIVTVAGAVAGDMVTANSVTDLGNNYILHANVTAADTVTIRITQVAGAAASPLPAGGNINIEVRGY